MIDIVPTEFIPSKKRDERIYSVEKGINKFIPSKKGMKEFIPSQK